jgi:hypothetical protein
VIGDVMGEHTDVDFTWLSGFYGTVTDLKKIGAPIRIFVFRL